MSPAIRRFAFGVLAAWLLLLSGLVYPQLAAHASEHAHHAATTHATALCSWLCAAGQTAEYTPPPRFLVADLSSPAWRPVSHVAGFLFVIASGSRGPPADLFLL
ncbi:MAG: hypothetical protein U0412_08555 [Nitrospira sp.]